MMNRQTSAKSALATAAAAAVDQQATYALVYIIALAFISRHCFDDILTIVIFVPDIIIVKVVFTSIIE